MNKLHSVYSMNYTGSKLGTFSQNGDAYSPMVPTQSNMITVPHTFGSHHGSGFTSSGKAAKGSTSDYFHLFNDPNYAYDPQRDSQSKLDD